MPKMVCRRNRLDKKPYCLTHTCYYKSKGMCEGAIHAEHGYYSYYNCPDEPDTGGQPRCGTHPECDYCKQYENRQGYLK